MRTSSSHEEGCQRQWSICTKTISGIGTKVAKLHCCRVEWIEKNNRWKMKEITGSEFTLKADLVILALGFLHVAHEGLIKDLGVKLDHKGNVSVNNHQTSEPWVFAAGDAVTGASLVVRAIDSGRQGAEAINNWLREHH